MNDSYRKACTEVLEIISYFPNEEYSKIPKEEIEFLKSNMNSDYNYKIDPTIDLSEQEISKDANAILVSLFRDYFATEKQKESLNILLNQNQQKLENEKNEKYNPNEIFKQKINIKQDETQEKETSLMVYKKDFFSRFIDFIKKIFSK